MMHFLDMEQASSSWRWHRGSSPKLIRIIDVLKSLDSHSHLVFNAMDFGPNGLGWSGGNMMHFLDMEQALSMKCRYTDA